MRRGQRGDAAEATPPLVRATAVLQKMSNAIVNAGARGVDPRPLRRELTSVADQLDLAAEGGESLGSGIEDYKMWAALIRDLVPLCDRIAAGDSVGARAALREVMLQGLPESFPGREKWL